MAYRCDPDKMVNPQAGVKSVNVCLYMDTLYSGVCFDSHRWAELTGVREQTGVYFPFFLWLHRELQPCPNYCDFQFLS